MKNLNDLAEKINSEIAPHFPFFKCEFSTNLCDSITVRLSLQKKEEWTNNIFHNSPYLIFLVFAERQREENSNPEKYCVESASDGLGREKKKMRKKTGNLEAIFAHIKKYLLTVA
jgi:hypothetical protein